MQMQMQMQMSCVQAMLASALYLDANQSLRYVDVTHNDIGERGCMGLADMAKENRALRGLVTALRVTPCNPHNIHTTHTPLVMHVMQCHVV